MSINRLREIVLPLLIAMLTTLLTVGTLSLLLQPPASEASKAEARTVYLQ